MKNIEEEQNRKEFAFFGLAPKYKSPEERRSTTWTEHPGPKFISGLLAAPLTQAQRHLGASIKTQFRFEQPHI